MTLDLPPALEPYRAKLEATVKPFVALEKADGEPGVGDSKVGGAPYWPKDLKYPTNSSGKPLYLLAQLNLDDLPKLGGFPQTGMLQFFIEWASGYGQDYDDPTSGKGHRVVYHPRADLPDEQLEVKPPQPPQKDFDSRYEFLPFEPRTHARLSGTLSTAPLSLEDAGWVARVGVSPFDFDEKIVEAYRKRYRGNGHKLGGYPEFVQDDPRADGDDSVLLFQLDSDDALHLMWGDLGVANFFIKPGDLEKLDFSRVLYHWDCS